MKLRMYSILDNKTDAHMQPFFFRTDAEAIRAVADIVNRDETHQFARHPEDFTLCFHCEFDDSSINAPIKEVHTEPLIDLVQMVEYKED